MAAGSCAEIGRDVNGNYGVPGTTLEREIEVKKSRFIAWVERVATRDAALQVLCKRRAAHPQASHHCWAYLLGDPQAASSAAMSDDGEPSGTAGKPILNVIQHKHIGDVMVVVTRYFGGTKLGAGGLVRAYAGATEAVLSALTVEQRVQRLQAALEMDFAQEQGVRHWADVHGAEVVTVDYGQRVRMGLSIDRALLDQLQDFCAAHGIVLRMHEG